jgi:hypothetical protein
LFVFELRPEQVHRYTDVVRARLSKAAFTRIEAKISGGLGVEVYYYPNLPVRAADLFFNEIRTSCASALTSQALEETFSDWIGLMAEMLHLGYMPFAPWNHGMGGCVDPGNACMDGGFNDLLTIVPFDSIPGELLFWRSLSISIQMLAGTIAAVCAIATGSSSPSAADLPASSLAYVTERLRSNVRSARCACGGVDSRLLRFFETPSVEDVFRHVREQHRDGSPAQFRQPSVTELDPVAARPNAVNADAVGV